MKKYPNNNLTDAQTKVLKDMEGGSWGPMSITANSETDGKAEIIKLLLDLDGFELKISSKDEKRLFRFYSNRLFADIKSKEQS